jgi:hypothetical protein
VALVWMIGAGYLGFVLLLTWQALRVSRSWRPTLRPWRLPPAC